MQGFVAFQENMKRYNEPYTVYDECLLKRHALFNIECSAC